MDYNKDGIIDIISTTYSKGAWFFKGLGKVKYADKEKITLSDGKGFGMKDLRYIAHSVILEDWDQDGDLDLITNNLFNKNGFEVFNNEGSDKAPKYNVKGKYIKTITETGINGFSVVYYDLNGDGLKDFIASDDYNGITWYKNVGSKRNPKFEDKKFFIGKELTEKEKDATNDLSIPVKYTEDENKSLNPSWGKIHFSFADINGDGKDDLLVGDAFFKQTQAKQLNAEETKHYAKTRKEFAKLKKILDPITKKRRQILNDATAEGKRAVMPKELEIDEDLIDQINKLTGEIRRINSEITKIEKFGRVWVYIRK